MEVLELKPVKNKIVTAYVFAREGSRAFQEMNISELTNFLEKKNIKFVTVDFEVNLKEFSNNQFAKTLNDLNIKYFQVDIPEFAMNYIYHEVLEKEKFITELIAEYQNLEDKESYKGQSLKNWIDMLNLEIQEKEIYLSLRLRPMWIVKKMLDIAKKYKEEEVSFAHFVQQDICEDICSQIVEQLRELNVKVIQYNKKHTIKNIVF
ncbi:MAG: hypothetical protein ACFFAH_12970 [Promethearchaeota archaeon]